VLGRHAESRSSLDIASEPKTRRATGASAAGPLPAA
jgi:hypothetical protein